MNKMNNKLKIILYLFLFAFIGCRNTAEQNLYVGSYNLRYANSGDVEQGDGWKQRLPVVAQLIRFHDFDIFGTQEGLHSQLTDLQNSLPEYAYVGVGRNDGETEGEFTAIFYKKDKFKLINSGTFWLSENSESPNVGWDAALPRICTWAEFEWDKKRFRFFNTHFDHVGHVARKNSAILIMEKIREMCGTDPVILTGDLNIDQNDESYSLFDSSDILDDCFKRAQIVYALNGTFNNFRVNGWNDKRIDHIFVTPNFEVIRYGILTDSYRTKIEPEEDPAEKQETQIEGGVRRRERYAARTPSDHYPIKVELRFN